VLLHFGNVRKRRAHAASHSNLFSCLFSSSSHTLNNLASTHASDGHPGGLGKHRAHEYASRPCCSEAMRLACTGL
jgi:hypothetical protein